MEDDNRISITVCGDGGCGMSSHPKMDENVGRISVC